MLISQDFIIKTFGFSLIFIFLYIFVTLLMGHKDSTFDLRRPLKILFPILAFTVGYFIVHPGPNPTTHKFNNIFDVSIQTMGDETNYVSVKNVDPQTKNLQSKSILAFDVKLFENIQVFHDVPAAGVESLSYTQHQFCVSDVQLHLFEKGTK